MIIIKKKPETKKMKQSMLNVFWSAFLELVNFVSNERFLIPVINPSAYKPS